MDRWSSIRRRFAPRTACGSGAPAGAGRWRSPRAWEEESTAREKGRQKIREEIRRAEAQLRTVTEELRKEKKIETVRKASTGLGAWKGEARGAGGGAAEVAAASGVGRRSEDSASEVYLQTPENTLDLRGMYVDDALSEVDIFLDRPSLPQTSPAFLLHLQE